MNFPQGYVVATMLEDNVCPPPHFAMEYIGKSPNSEACISKTFDLNDIKFGTIVKKVIFYIIAKVWKCSP